jgi:hypothetical protein
MNSEAPESQSISSASKWCDSTSEAGCVKPITCKPGHKYAYYFFSVENPLEVMEGHQAEIKEMSPVTIIKSTDRVNINATSLEMDGTIQWQEAYTYDVIDGLESAPLLDQIITIPNPSMFTTIITQDGTRISSDAILYTMAAAKFYTAFQEIINTKTNHLPTGTYFSGRTAINFPTLIQDQYRSGAFTRAVGEILASPACSILVRIVLSGISSPIPAETAVPILCHDGYKNNIGMSVFGVLLGQMGLRISPSDSPFFYEFEKNCKQHSRFPSHACYLSDVCPFDAESAEYSACIEPSLSESDTRNLFKFFAFVSKNVERDESKNAVLDFLGKGCRLGSGKRLRNRGLCQQVQRQLLSVGRAATVGMNPKRKELLAAYGWGGSGLDMEIGSKVVPYFIKGTIRELMGLGVEKPRKDPLTGTPLGLNKWINSLRKDGSITEYISQPIRQVVSSRFTDVPNRFVSVDGRNFSCAFDYGCMSQSAFIGSSGRTCKPVPGECNPVVINGTDIGYSNSANMFGSGTVVVGEKSFLFMPEFFLNAEFSLNELNVDMGDGLRVNKWTLTNVTNNRYSCEALPLGTSRGIDCDSPTGSMNIGYHMTYEIKRASPLFMHLPLYASFPHFRTPEGLLGMKTVYVPTDKILITECAGCRELRADDNWSATELWTEPETGAHIHGSQKLQLNVRFTGNTSRLSRGSGGFGNPTNDVDAANVAISENVDLLIPIFWANKFDSIAPFQATKLVTLQGVPKKLNIIFAMLLLIAVVGIVAGTLSIVKGWKLIKMQQRSAFMQRSITGKGISTVGDETERASTIFSCHGSGEGRGSGNESDESSAPRPLAPI